MANGEEALRNQSMIDDKIDKAVSARRSELEALSLRDVGREFEATYQIAPKLSAGKEILVQRILAKFRAELERHS